MKLILDDEEARTLRDILHDFLPDLRREAAATDIAARELRHELVKREELCERLSEALDQALNQPAGSPV